jgi:ATP synthase, F1 delta subunit
MISQRSLTYAKILFSMEVKEDSVNQMKQLLSESRELTDALSNPAIKQQEKEAVIDALFETEVRSFLKVLCENKVIGLFSQIIEAYEDLVLEHKNVVKAKFVYAIKPSDGEIEQIKGMICDKYKKSGVFLEMEQDDSLIGGYVLTVGNTEYNKSIKGALSEMQKALIRR